MTIPNHDTGLEEILTKFGRDYDTPYRLMHDKDKSPIEQLPLARAQLIAETLAALHTYLYKQTLELIGPHMSLTKEEIVNGRIYRLGDPQGDAVDRYKDELAKAAAERWGQE